MQAGIPVIGSDIPGNRDLISDQTGRLFKLGDTADLARQSNDLLESPEVARQLGEAATRKIETEFSVGAMVEAHSELYRRMTGH